MFLYTYFVFIDATRIYKFQFCQYLNKRFNATSLECGQMNEAYYNFKGKPGFPVKNSNLKLKKVDKICYWYAFFDFYPLHYIVENQSFIVIETIDGNLIAPNTTLLDY